MKSLITISIILLFLLPTENFGQSTPQGISIHINVSPEIGRWVYDRGEGPDGENLGFDRSTLSLLISSEIGLNYKIDKFNFGLVGGLRSLFANELIGSQHASSSRLIYRVSSSEKVQIISVSIVFGYDLVCYENFNLTPMLSIGAFSAGTNHPDKDDFGFPLSWSGSFQFEWEKQGYSLMVTPHFINNIIFPESGKNMGQLNSIYSMGIKGGVKFWLSNRSKEE